MVFGHKYHPKHIQVIITNKSKKVKNEVLVTLKLQIFQPLNLATTATIGILWDKKDKKSYM